MAATKVSVLNMRIPDSGAPIGAEPEQKRQPARSLKM
jgi:hypothetical protein